MSSVEPLVYRIATNVATSRLRKRRVWRWISLEGLGVRTSRNAGAEELVADAEQRIRVRRAVESLPMDLRKVIVLCELAELSYQQVADSLEIPVGTVGSRRHRGLELLRRKLGGDHYAE
jgi:RNA polymerase sigma-70 factor (ECF subfamily)